MDIIKIHPTDNVAVALKNIKSGDTFELNGDSFVAEEDIAKGHKISLCEINEGSAIIKYGCVIGYAQSYIKKGLWVHTHNVKTGLTENSKYTYNYKEYPMPAVKSRNFMGYLRDDGKAAVRNEIWIIPTVGCVNGIAQTLVKENQHLVNGNVEGLYAFTHPFGCSQMGDDHANTRKLLAALAQHPNAGGVLILSLGCENLTIEQFKEELGEWDDRRVKFLVCQEEEDELLKGAELLKELSDYASGFERKPIPADKLIVGMKCGGSDGLSGITANPAVGNFSDKLISLGGTTILTEVPEMFGAENILFERCHTEEIFKKAVTMVEDFKNYYISHNQVVYENPSPGNKKGGITTLEDKSCGCVQKGGKAPIDDVLNYGDIVKKSGLNLLSGPGNDLVSATALTAAGAHIILFTTGRGTPFGAPAPTLKISTNSELFSKKSNWIDFNAGVIAEGESIDCTGEDILDLVIEIASGKKTKNEILNNREISILKDGVVL